MAWTAPMTAVANAVFTAAQFNTNVRDNLNETAPAKATTAGAFLAVTGLNSIAERIPSVDVVDTSETTSSTSFTDLTTPGPSVTVDTAVNALMLITAELRNNTGGNSANAGVEVSGASTLSPSSLTSLNYESSNANDRLQCSYAFLRTDLTPGSNVFTMKYRSPDGTAAGFANRRLVIIPF